MPSGADQQQPSVFELVLNADEAPEVDGTPAASVDPGAAFVVRCIAEERFEPQRVILEKDQQHIPTTSTNPGRVEVSVSSFDVVSDPGLYQCEASTIDGVVHSRQLRVTAKRSAPSTSDCPPGARDKCGPNGVCGMIKNEPTCFCHFEFVGKNCDTRLVTDFDRNVYQVAAGASGTLSVVCFALIVLLGVMYFKERRRTKKLIAFYGPLPAPINVYGDLPENPYKYSDFRPPAEPQAPKRTDSLRMALRFPGGRIREESEEQKELRPRVELPSVS